MDQPSSTESNAITLRIRFKSASLDQFIGRYGADVSPGGIFIRTKQPVDVGTSLQFDFTLGDGSPLLSGMGTVAWVRESDPARANNVPGMGLRFDKLTAESQHTHQLILAEKARMEGKASSTPYPPTAFVAPPARTSPAPEAPKPAAESAKPEAATNLAITRPAPASAIRPPTPVPPARPATPPPSSRPAGIPPLAPPIPPLAGRPATVPPVTRPATPPPPAVVPQPNSPFNFASDADEFSESGKTEVSDKPLDYYLKEAEAAEAAKAAELAREADKARPSVKTTEDAVPESLLDDAPTGATELPVTQSGPPPEGYEVAQPPAGQNQPYPPSASSPGSPVDLVDSPEGEAVSIPSGEIMPELSAGTAIEEAAPEKTAEVSAAVAPGPVDSAPVEPPMEGAPTLDLGTGLEGFSDERPPSREGASSKKPKGSGRAVVLIAVAAAAAAFIAVYLAKTKPWQEQSKPSAPVAVAENVPAAENPAPAAPAPAPVPAAEPVKAAAEPVKPTEEPVAANKPVVAEAPKAAAKAEQAEPAKAEPAKVEPAKKEPEKTAEKSEPAAEKAPAEKAEKHAKGESEGKSGKAASKATRWDDKPAAADDEIYRLVVRSAPLSAEVLIDGEYFSRTPCERRILDPTKPFKVVIRKEGYEPQERVVSPSDNWARKGEERVLTVTASLKKAKPGASPAAPADEAKPEKKAEAPAPAAKLEPAPEAAKPAAAKEPVAKSEPAAPKPEPAKPAAKPEPAKPAAPPAAEKPAYKPAPSFDDPGKAKE